MKTSINTKNLYSIIYKDGQPILLEHKSCYNSFKELGPPTEAEIFFWNALNDEMKKGDALFDELCRTI